MQNRIIKCGASQNPAQVVSCRPQCGFYFMFYFILNQSTKLPLITIVQAVRRGNEMELYTCNILLSVR